MPSIQFLRFVPYGFVIGGLIACTDHQNPIRPNQQRLESITHELPNRPAKVSAFGYDAQNRLQTITTCELTDSRRADAERSLYRCRSERSQAGSTTC